jgi:hypothetical protein
MSSNNGTHNFGHHEYVKAATLRLDRLDAAVRILAIATRTLLAVMAALVLISKVTG